MHRGRLVVDDVVDAGRTVVESDNRSRGCILDVNEGCDAGARADDGKHSLHHLPADRPLGRVVRAGAIELAIAQDESLDPIRAEHLALVREQRPHPLVEGLRCVVERTGVLVLHQVPFGGVEEGDALGHIAPRPGRKSGRHQVAAALFANAIGWAVVDASGVVVLRQAGQLVYDDLR